MSAKSFTNKKLSIEKLELIANDIRQDLIKSLEEAGSVTVRPHWD